CTPPPPLACAATDSEVSRGGFLENRDVEHLVGDHLLQPRILALEILHPLHLVDFDPAVLLPPAEVGLIRDRDLLADLPDRNVLRLLHLRRPQPRDVLLGTESLSRHRALPRMCPPYSLRGGLVLGAAGQWRDSPPRPRGRRRGNARSGERCGRR